MYENEVSCTEMLLIHHHVKSINSAQIKMKLFLLSCPPEHCKRFQKVWAFASQRARPLVAALLLTEKVEGDTRGGECKEPATVFMSRVLV